MRDPRLQQRKLDALQALFEQKHKQGLFDGTVLVAQHGEVLYSACHGWENYVSKLPLTLRSRFELASITKPLTALGVRLLIQQHMLKEDDLLQAWLPDIPYSGIKLKHLLNHT